LWYVRRVLYPRTPGPWVAGERSVAGGLNRTEVLMSALVRLAQQILLTLGVGAGIEALVPGQQFGFGGGGGDGGVFGFGGPVRRRRRRRKALTASDLATALTLATAISKKAAEVFILQRTRAS